jgi:transglutaminase-like putative cysteine protease
LVRYLAIRDGRIPVELTGTGSAQPDLLPMVTLTGFDGRNWTIGADYRRAGTEFSARPQAGPVRGVDLDVRVLTPASIGWLPRAGAPRTITVDGMGFDAGTGDVVVPAGRDTPRSYRITGSEQVPGPDDIADDDPAAVPADTPPLPPEVLTFIDTATAGRTPGIGQFHGLYHALKDGAFQYDDSAEAASGHGVRQIADLLRTKRGTSEQYASAFAVLGRHLGWDTRVVLGFRPAWDGNHFRVRGQDVYTWVQVRFQRLGWVLVDPSPSMKVGEQNGANDRAAPKSAVDQMPAPDQPNPQEPVNPLPAQVSTATPASTMDYTVLVPAAGLAVILCLAAIPVTKTARRHRRRRTGSARRRATAAWRDAVDAMRDAGIPVTERHTTGEATAIAGAVLLPLANLVDQAAYAPDAIGDDTAADAWRHADTLRAHVRTAQTPWRRIRASFSPRSLLRNGITRPYRSAYQSTVDLVPSARS